MSMATVAWVLEQRVQDPGSKLVLLIIALCSGGDARFTGIWRKHVNLAGMDEDEFALHLRALERDGFIGDLVADQRREDFTLVLPVV